MKSSANKSAQKTIPAAMVPTVFKKSDQDDLDALNLVQKDPRAFAHFVYKYQEILLVKIVKAVKDQDYAQDILQDIFQKVFVNINKYEKRFTFNAWLTRVADNYLIDIIRKRKRSPEFFNTVELDAAFGHENNSDSKQVFELADENSLSFDDDNYEDQHEKSYSKVEALIRELDEQDQAILNLFYLERKRQQDIAKILGISHGSVRVRLNRLKKRLLKMAGGENLVGLVPSGENMEMVTG